MGFLESNPGRKLSPNIPEEEIEEVAAAMHDAVSLFLQNHQDWSRLEADVQIAIRQLAQHSFERGRAAALDSLKN